MTAHSTCTQCSKGFLAPKSVVQIMLIQSSKDPVYNNMYYIYCGVGPGYGMGVGDTKAYPALLSHDWQFQF